MEKTFIRDTSKKDYQYYFYDARNSDRRGQKKVQVLDKSRYFFPTDAFIEIEGQILYTPGANPYAASETIGFVHNEIIAFFDSARYKIDGKEIEVIHKDLDVATTIIRLARYSDAFTRSAGPKMMFTKDNSDHQEDSQFQLVQVERDTVADPQPDGFEALPAAAFSMLK